MVKRSAAYMGASIPVTHTSPSPYAPCASPQLNSADEPGLGVAIDEDVVNRYRQS